MLARIACCILALTLGQAALAQQRNLVPVSTRAQPADERRAALVIGNAAYGNAPLANPVNDARAMADVLQALGFAVTKLENVGQERMYEAIRAFGDELRAGGTGLFYFAGHAVQVRGRNYLIPVGARIEREDEIVYRSVDANQILDKMESARNRVNIVILDACRNNPFARNFRALDTGLAVMEAPVNTLIAFATAPGAVASDGSGKNGLYTQHLVLNIPEQGLRVEEMFKRVRAGVRRDSAGRQIPWENTSLEVDFYFQPQLSQVAAGAATGLLAIELAFWDSVKTSALPADYEAYLRRYPSGQFADLAANRLREMRAAAVPAAPAVPPQRPAVPAAAPTVASIAPAVSIAPAAPGASPAETLPGLAGHTQAVTALGIAANGRYALSGSSDQSLRLWDLATNQELRRYLGHSGAPLAVAFSPDGRSLLSGGEDKTVRMWNFAGGNELRRFIGHSSAVAALAYAPNARYVASGSEDGSVRLWDLRENREARLIDAHRGGVRSIAFSPDGRYILSGGNDRAVRLWDTSGNAPPREFGPPAEAPLAVAFSADGRSLRAVLADGTLRSWDSASGRELERSKLETGAALLKAASLTLDMRHAIALRGDGGTILAGAAGEMQQIGTPGGNTATAVALFADGRRALIAGEDRIIRIWGTK